MKARPRRGVVLVGLSLLLLLGLGVVGLQALRKRGEPPDNLSAREAVDLACFQGWSVNGQPAYVPAPRQVLVSELSGNDARDFLRRQGVTANLPPGGLTGYFARTFVVVARGTVSDGLASDAAPRGDGLVLVVDPDGTVRDVSIGSPWNTVVPPGAQELPVPGEPDLSNVSRARARLELGGRPLVELDHPPGGLALRKITINPDGLPVDPSGTEYPGRSVTLSYADGTGRPRLWLTQSASDAKPRIFGRPIPLRQLPGGVTPYAWYAGTFELDGFSWTRQGQALFLTAEPGPDLTTDALTQAVLALAPAAR